MKTIKTHKIFNGTLTVHEHDSVTTKTPMRFSSFVPAGKIRGCLIWLSGLECNEETFQIKAGAHKALSDTGMMIICPDTSPRGLNLPEEHESWDYGSAASFYVDATTPGYRDHYKMFSYVTSELYDLVSKEFGVAGHISISGHSMGGHGALVCGLREPTKFKSVSAFAPIVNPMAAPWGKKAFTGYLGTDETKWEAYDACALLRAGHTHPQEVLVDQGSTDKFLKEQLLTENLSKAT
ncbi:MAG: S-formylglutathione hydrolase, partial [Bdellovibrionota bacterium]